MPSDGQETLLLPWQLQGCFNRAGFLMHVWTVSILSVHVCTIYDTDKVKLTFLIICGTLEPK